jgi:hypothetical protein
MRTSTQAQAKESAQSFASMFRDGHIEQGRSHCASDIRIIFDRKLIERHKMQKEIVTSDLSRFGYRELDMAGEILRAYAKNGSPDNFDTEGLKLMMNANSGYVFLTNEECDVLMMTDDGKLEKWHSCPICGHEGFSEDMAHNEDDEECQQYLEESGLK